jgi:hypothetical protein
MFSVIDDVAIKLPVEMVGNRAVNHIDIFALQQLLVIGRRKVDRGHVGSKPLKCRFIRVTDRHENRTHVQVAQVDPTRRGAGELAPH